MICIMVVLYSTYVHRSQTLPAGLGVYGYHPPDADDNLTAKSKALS